MILPRVALVAAHLATVSAQVFSCIVVAHPDDALLFLSPSLLHDVTAARCTTVLYLTSGDAGIGSKYARSRESGSEIAAAVNAGVPDSYTEFNATFAGQPLLVRTLVNASNVQHLWLRLPDGGYPDGLGYAANNYESLEKLYFGQIPTISSSYGAKYSKSSLDAALGEILLARLPSNVRTLDFSSPMDDGDHHDHHVTARIARDAVEAHLPNATLTGYAGYPISNLPSNVAGSDLVGKQQAFFAYAAFDSEECQSVSDCANSGRSESGWLTREYKIDTVTAASEAAADVLEGAPGFNLARIAQASSSAGYGPSQSPAAAIDGIVDGFGGSPGDTEKEWASTGGVSTTLLLSWTEQHTIGQVVLHDRINPSDQITSGSLRFNDAKNTTIAVGALANDGTATIVSFPVVTASTMLFRILSVSSSTGSPGLAEIEVYSGATVGNISSLAMGSLPSPGPVANSTGYNVTAANTALPPAASIVHVNVSPSSSSILPSLSVSAPSTTSSAADSSPTLPVSQAAAVPSSSSATRSPARTSSTGPLQSSIAAVPVVPVPAPTFDGYFKFDLALSATASASSSQPGSEPSQAIDGALTSYPGDATQEWVSNGEGVGAQLTLHWDSPQVVNTVVLFDLPSPDEWIRGGAISFSDGSGRLFGALDNAGSPKWIKFPTRTITSLTVTVTAVSPSTRNVGLAELAVFAPAFPPAPAHTSKPSPARFSPLPVYRPWWMWW